MALANIHPSIAQIILNGTANQLGSDTGESFCGDLTLVVPQNSGPAKSVTWLTRYEDKDGNMTSLFGSANYNQSSAVDAVRFLMSSGNLESGTITLYKYAGS